MCRSSSPLRSTTNNGEPPSPPVASTSATLLPDADFAGPSAAPPPSANGEIPDAQATAYSCGIERNQQVSDFDFSFLFVPDPNYGNFAGDRGWLNSLTFDSTFPAAPY
ncbi:hypothetical protein B0H13DRAFT_2315434 [Mycena leptocephala]|nr:hypothetical protein B0H13DRAFT_2315434 [Mycena leptocephala]